MHENLQQAELRANLGDKQDTEQKKMTTHGVLAV